MLSGPGRPFHVCKRTAGRPAFHLPKARGYGDLDLSQKAAYRKCLGLGRSGLGLATVPVVPRGTRCLWMNHIALGPYFLPSGKGGFEMCPL